MRLSVWLGVALIIGAAAVGYAWSAGPTKVTVLFENDRVKVLHVTKSGRAHTTAESDDHLIVPLSDFTSKETRDGKTEVLLRKKGQAVLAPGRLPRLRYKQHRRYDCRRLEAGPRNHD